MYDVMMEVGGSLGSFLRGRLRRGADWTGPTRRVYLRRRVVNQRLGGRLRFEAFLNRIPMPMKAPCFVSRNEDLGRDEMIGSGREERGDSERNGRLMNLYCWFSRHLRGGGR